MILSASAVGLAGWESFFSGLLTALGALTGLLFVAISNNLEQILQIPNIVWRAAQALWTLVVLLVVCAVPLSPQPVRAAGIEIIFLSGLSLAIHIPRHVMAFRQDDLPDRRRWSLSRLIATAPSLALCVAGGIAFTAGSTDGAYWTGAGIIAGILGATYSSWVLLVEVVRKDFTSRKSPTSGTVPGDSAFGGR